MSTITQGPAEDQGFFEYLKNEGHAKEVLAGEHFEGLEQFIQAVLPLSTIIVPIVIAYITAKKDLAVIIDGQKFIYKGYNIDEINDLLKEHIAKADRSDGD